ncbi:MAG: cupredoxin domain-containing protein [Chloroflexota bacterium]
MTAQRVAGWVAVVAGVLVLVGIASSAIGGAGGPITSSPTAYWPMGPGMMGFGNAGPAATTVPGAAEVRVQAANFGFTPSEIRLPKNADVNLSLVNPAGTGVVHDITVPELGIHVVANPGETRTVGLRGLAAGRYDAYCSVPGHADLGMRASVIVE